MNGNACISSGGYVQKALKWQKQNVRKTYKNRNKMSGEDG